MIEHPFVGDLSHNNPEKLQEIITDLNTKITHAYRTGNQALIHQLSMAIESHRLEYQRQMDKIFANQNFESQINVQSK